jgi:hypothetical protein
MVYWCLSQVISAAAVTSRNTCILRTPCRRLGLGFVSIFIPALPLFQVTAFQFAY